MGEIAVAVEKIRVGDCQVFERNKTKISQVYYSAYEFLNLHDGCVANKIIKGKQITICFHVDDCKISHEVPQVIDETIDWYAETL